ncbi:MAG: hypothetical protein NZ583_02145 [Desulfobacterota bacterium]|nr:hypothetical protein [Thermodesulfobacteriota bacterium]MDW8001686.1 hypothetical protein [Deltaproteobacteria bacterium]
MKRCYNCGTELNYGKVSRRDECPKCGKELHVCLNCRFYDKSKAYLCAEVRADPPLDKDRANFCEYFELKEEEEQKTGRLEAERIWQEIFKKKK